MNGPRGLVIAIAASLVVGISIGMISSVLILRLGHTMMGPLGPPRPPWIGPGRPGDPMAAQGRRMLIDRLDHELELDPEQRAQVVAVLESARVVHEAARDSVRARIDRILTPAQLARWRDLERRYGGMWRRRAGPPPWEGRR